MSLKTKENSATSSNTEALRGRIGFVLKVDIEAVYREHIAMVRGRARRILGDEAASQDIAQETFVKLISYRSQGESDRDPAAFLFTTVTNLALNRLRDGRSQSSLRATRVAPAFDEGIGLAIEDQLALRAVMARVPEEEARIASYHYWEGMEQPEMMQYFCAVRSRQNVSRAGKPIATWQDSLTLKSRRR